MHISGKIDANDNNSRTTYYNMMHKGLNVIKNHNMDNFIPFVNEKVPELNPKKKTWWQKGLKGLSAVVSPIVSPIGKVEQKGLESGGQLLGYDMQKRNKLTKVKTDDSELSALAKVALEAKVSKGSGNQKGVSKKGALRTGRDQVSMGPVRSYQQQQRAKSQQQQQQSRARQQQERSRHHAERFKRQRRQQQQQQRAGQQQQQSRVRQQERSRYQQQRAGQQPQKQQSRAKQQARK
jgi:hypothetical protein